MKFVVLSAADVDRLLTMEAAIESQRVAFRALADGSGVLAPKMHVDGADGSLALNYTARVAASGPAVSKFVSVNPRNLDHNLPFIHGVISVLDSETGQLRALMDGTSITTLRTAAASAVAADVLARKSAKHLVVVGNGVQAAAHIRALCLVREFETITLVGRRAAKVNDLAQELTEELGRPVVGSIRPETVVPGADVIALTTSSFTPVIEHGWVSPGALVISVGSFTPDRCEVQRATVTAATLVVVDDLATSLEHAGPIIRAVETGSLPAASIAELGAIVNGAHRGRAGEDDVIFYNSVGVGIQDAAAAEAVLAAAIEAEAGQQVEL